MSFLLGRLRLIVPAASRERFYSVATTVITVLASYGALDSSQVAQWTALCGALVTLLFAAVHSTSSWRTGLYSMLAAGQGVAQLYGLATDTQWASVLGLAAAVLGITVAAAKTQPGND